MRETTKIGKVLNDKHFSFLLVVNITKSRTCFYWLNIRPLTVFEVISDMWNSPEFNPVAPASACHSDFQSCTTCLFKQVEGLAPATPQKIEGTFASMRSELLRIITQWKQSGWARRGRNGCWRWRTPKVYCFLWWHEILWTSWQWRRFISAVLHRISWWKTSSCSPKPSCVSQRSTILSALLLGSCRHAPTALIFAPSLEQ